MLVKRADDGDALLPRKVTTMPQVLFPDIPFESGFELDRTRVILVTTMG
jgi:hypothetical protein